MDKQKQQLIGLGALVLVLVVLMVNAFMPKKPRPNPVPSAAAPASGLAFTPPAAAPESKIETGYAKATSDEINEQLAHAQKDWGADPFFRRAGKEVLQGSSLTLKGISMGSGRRKYAAINDQIVTVGDIIFDYRVEEIEKTRVLLKRGTESYYLVWPEP